MSKLSRLIGMASNALDKNGSSQSAPGGGTDWRNVVRSAAGALTGDDRTQRPGGGDTATPAGGYAPPAGAGYAPPAGAGYAPPAGAGYAPPAGAGYAPPAEGRRTPPPAAATGEDRAAIARYDYLLQTADPHRIEQIHREAFARLSPEQRAHVEARMRAELPLGEQPRSAGADDLARAAARGEARRPGTLRALLARAGGRPRGRSGSGGAALGAAGGVLAAVAGGAIVSSVAGPLLEQAAGLGVDFDALGAGLDLDGLASGADGLAGGVEGYAGDVVSGVGEQVSGFGEQVSGFEIPGLGDLFGR